MESTTRKIRFRKLIAILFITMMLTAPLPAVGQTTGSISGTIVETGASNPIVGAMIIAIPFDTPWDPPGFGFTDANGEYMISGLVEGDYLVRVMPFEQHYIPEYFPDTIHMAEADVVAVVAGENTPDIDFELSQGGSISGAVVDMNGAGIADIMIYAWFGCFEGIANISVTDASGTYTVPGLPAGPVYVEARSSVFSEPSYVRKWYEDAAPCEDAPPVTVNIGSTTQDINFQLEIAGSISGIIYESDGITPVTDMPVGIFTDPCEGSPFIIATLTDDSGSYSFYGLEPGDIYVKTSNDLIGPLGQVEKNYLREWYNDALSCSEAAPVAITAGIEAAGIDFLLSDDSDVDGDGMPDEWEAAYFGDMSRNGSEDFDGDGSADLLEYQAGSYPLDSNPDTDASPDDGGDETDGGSGGSGGCFISTVMDD